MVAEVRMPELSSSRPAGVLAPRRSGDQTFPGAHMLHSTRFRAMGATLALLAASTLCAQDRGKPAPEELTGPKVGEKAPTFTLKDQAGSECTLDEFLKKGKVALVFYRS